MVLRSCWWEGFCSLLFFPRFTSYRGWGEGEDHNGLSATSFSIHKEPACQCRRFLPWVRKIPWRKKWQPTPVFLPGKSHGQRSLVGHGPWNLKRVRHDLVTKQQQKPDNMWLTLENSADFVDLLGMSQKGWNNRRSQNVSPARSPQHGYTD